MATDTFDVLIIGDARFQGGTTTAMASDVSALAALGARIGLLFVQSNFLSDLRDPPNPLALELADLEAVTLLSDGAAARGEVAFLHHPQVFFQGFPERACLSSDRAVIVAHHAPFRADGSLEYDPISSVRRARAAIGLRPWFAPVSGLIRNQLQSFAPLIRLTSEDWPNTFNIDDWREGPDIFVAPEIVIGRHGRADRLKWPETGSEIDASLPAGPDCRVRVLGCPAPELRADGANLDDWEILEFGAENVQDFLHSLDIFVYHYHPNLVEAFGRTIAEAALSGRLCLVDPRLEPVFGEAAVYCRPEEVAEFIGRFRSDPVGARKQARKGAALIKDWFGLQSVERRLAGLREDQGTVARAESAVAPLRTAKKLVGLYRRRSKGGLG